VTFCLGIRIKDGLVGIADTRITTGSECIIAKKVSILSHGGHQLFLMTSGLRSVRDKALTYFEEVLGDRKLRFDKLYKIVNEFGKQIRRVAQEDKPALTESGLDFNLHALIGGQLAGDSSHKLFLLYPEGNWVEISEGTPYHIIGSARYGKPILDRALSHNTSMEAALKVGYLAFDATFMSATDVSFPIDVVLYRHGSNRIIERRFEKDDFLMTALWWQEHMVRAVSQLSTPQLDSFLTELHKEFVDHTEDNHTHKSSRKKIDSTTESDEKSNGKSKRKTSYNAEHSLLGASLAYIGQNEQSIQKQAPKRPAGNNRTSTKKRTS
jgi:putative proteasome-type protease